MLASSDRTPTCTPDRAPDPTGNATARGVPSARCMISEKGESMSLRGSVARGAPRPATFACLVGAVRSVDRRRIALHSAHRGLWSIRPARRIRSRRGPLHRACNRARIHAREGNSRAKILRVDPWATSSCWRNGTSRNAHVPRFSVCVLAALRKGYEGHPDLHF